MASLRDLARVSTATTGTGTVTLGAAVAGFLSFANAGVQDGERVTYAIKDGSNSELGRGVYTSSGTTLTRATILASTNSGGAISLSGSAQVFITAAAEDFMPQMPQGRLTLTTATPVLTSTVSGATTIYYAPYAGRCVPLYNGAFFQMHDIGGELSQATTDATKSPAACAANSNYDLFVWCDAGTFRCTRGPAWSSDTARGTGAGTTELERIAGILTNKNAITNGPGANRGTFVGTVRSNGSSAIDFVIGAQGTEALIGIWNCYNRCALTPLCGESTASWTYNSTTWRKPNNASSSRISFVRGLDEDAVMSIYQLGISSGASSDAEIGINLDSATAAPGGIVPYLAIDSYTAVASAIYSGFPGLGWHYLQAMERQYTTASAAKFISASVGSRGGITATVRY